MTDDQTLTVCPFCDKPVNPNDTGVTYAVEIRRVDTLGSTEHIIGLGALFHPGCPPGAVGYIPRQLPGADLTTP